MNEIKEDGKYAIVVKCKDLALATPGSKKIKCLKCHEECWLSPSLQNENLDGVICVQCINEKEIKEETKEAEFLVKKESITEFKKFIKYKDRLS